MQKETYLVVVSLLEGRNFPKKLKQQLVVECRFDGELLATDPISHDETPNFTTELAWEMDKKSLHQHRMQRTPVKLQCFAVDKSTKFRELVGYILLDLRAAQLKPKPPKWYPLLSSKYSRLKPAIKIGLMLEDDSVNENQMFKANDAPPRAMPEPFDAGGNVSAILNAADGYFQIGPDHTDCEIFVLSVTIGTAQNLEQLIHGDKALPSVTSGYFFYYSLFGSDITNDVFHDLLSPEITPERASIRIRTTVNALKTYFALNPELSVHLCCGDQLLGSTSIPFSSLVTQKTVPTLESSTVTINGLYTLTEDGKPAESRPNLPNVNAVVQLRKENVPVNAVLPEAPLEQAKEEVKPTDVAPKDDPVRDTDPLSEVKQPVTSNDTEDDAGSIISEKEEENPPSSLEHDEDKQSTLMTTETHSVIPPTVQHFRFTLNIKSIGKLDLPHSCNVYVKYVYPFFGSFAPVMTAPVEVAKTSEAILPQSMCVFDFACTQQMLTNTFRGTPVFLELWHRDAETNDVLLGTGSLSLLQILNTNQEKIVSQTNTVSYRQSCSGSVPLFNTVRKTVAELSIITVLEDLGSARDQNIVHEPRTVTPSIVVCLDNYL